METIKFHRIQIDKCRPDHAWLIIYGSNFKAKNPQKYNSSGTITIKISLMNPDINKILRFFI